MDHNDRLDSLDYIFAIIVRAAPIMFNKQSRYIYSHNLDYRHFYKFILKVNKANSLSIKENSNNVNLFIVFFVN